MGAEAVTLAAPEDEEGKFALVQRAMAGDRAALESLWSLHRRWVAAVILAHKPAQAELEDILQDVAASVVANISQVGQPGAFPGWLRTVAVNAARLAGRRASSGLARLGRLTGDAAEAALANAAAGGAWGGGAAGPGGAAGGHNPAAPLDPEHLLVLARQLPEGYGEALLLRAIKGLSYAEIGSIMNLPESTIETRIARGRRMLRELALSGGQGARAPHAARPAGTAGVTGATANGDGRAEQLAGRPKVTEHASGRIGS